MLVTITGAMKNVGDYLIGHRGRALLKKYVDPDIIDINRALMTEEDIDVMNKARAVILCGGPAYKPNSFPAVYPNWLMRVSTKIVPMGLGWCGLPVGKPESFDFDSNTLSILQKIHAAIPFSGTRDDDTHAILNRKKLPNKMTGCPAWYDLETFELDFTYRSEFRKIVVTTPAKVTGESFRVLKHVAHKFPKAEKICSFHRGILPDKYTTLRSSCRYSLLAAYAVSLGYKLVDASYDLSKIDFYKECDFHIGYRVHAHLFFLGRRLPSLLINEDGRGQGQAKTLGLSPLNMRDPQLFEKVDAGIESYFDTQGEVYAQAVQKTKRTFLSMEEFLSSI